MPPTRTEEDLNQIVRERDKPITPPGVAPNTVGSMGREGVHEQTEITRG